MLFAQKGNRVQPISEVEVQRYLNLGYNITDEKGKILYEAVPDDIISLKTAFKRHINEIESLRKQIVEIGELKAEIKKLADENAELKAKLGKPVMNASENVEVTEKTTPKRTRTKKNNTSTVAE